MTSTEQVPNRVRQRRLAFGMTQAALAASAGISRTAVTAIEGDRLVPSVAAALAIAQALECSVEELFGNSPSDSPAQRWAWPPTTQCASWQAEVLGQLVLYPSSSTAMLTVLPDQLTDGASTEFAAKATETLVMASCDPAAGILASQFQRTTGMRLIVLHRSSRQALELLRAGVVHLAGLHLSTDETPDQNTLTAKEALGMGFRMLRMANWQEGVVVAPTTRLRSIRSALQGKLTWVGREAGSGARQCLDRLFNDNPRVRHTARDHHGVAEAVRSGWVDAGVCVELVGKEAGLHFLPVQKEAYDVCFPKQLADDRRLKSFLSLIRSSDYLNMMRQCAGYDMRDTGSLWDL